MTDKILVIDDEEIIRKRLKKLLSLDSYEVFTADNGQQGLELFQKMKDEKHPIPIALVDIKMPGMDGIEVLKRIKEIAPKTEVIIITGHGAIESAIKALKTGAFNYITKPIEYDELVLDISRALEKQEIIAERERAEAQRAAAIEALRVSQESFHNIVERSADGIIVVDRNGIFHFINKTGETLLGRKSDELLGTVFGFPIVEGVFSEVDIIRKNGEVGTAEMRLEETFWKGKPSYLVLLRDITESKRMEEMIKESEQRYRDLVEKSGIAISLDDEKGNIKYINERFAELFGYSVKEIETKSIKTIVHPDDVERVIKFYDQRIHGKPVPSRYEFKGVKKDGTILYLEADVIVAKRGEKITGTRSYIWDITERKQIEDELKIAQEYSRYLVDSSLDIIISVDKNREIVEFNYAAQKTFGYSKEEVLGKHVNILYADQADGLKVHDKSRKAGRFSGEIINRRKNGEQFPSFLSSSILRDKKGEFIGVMGISRDITEQKQTEAELKKRLNELERFESVTIGRELKMIELKNKIKELEEQLKLKKSSE